eukprot:scaffold108684_cov50-Phaeocystis_antarctica.AAC.2
MDHMGGGGVVGCVAGRGAASAPSVVVVEVTRWHDTNKAPANSGPPHAGLQDSGRREGQSRGHGGRTWRVVVGRHAAAERDAHVLRTAGRPGDGRPPRYGCHADGQQLAAGVAGGDHGRGVAGHERRRQPSHGRDDPEARPSRGAAALPRVAGGRAGPASPSPKPSPSPNPNPDPNPSPNPNADLNPSPSPGPNPNPPGGSGGNGGAAARGAAGGDGGAAATREQHSAQAVVPHHQVGRDLAHADREQRAEPRPAPDRRLRVEGA